MDTASLFKPPHDKTNKMVCAPNEDSDQPEDLPSLIRAEWVVKEPSFLLVDSEGSDQTGHFEDSDQTGQMPRLI